MGEGWGGAVRAATSAGDSMRFPASHAPAAAEATASRAAYKSLRRPAELPGVLRDLATTGPALPRSSAGTEIRAGLETGVSALPFIAPFAKRILARSVPLSG